MIWLTGRMPSEEDYGCTVSSACDIVPLPIASKALAMRNKLYCGDNLDVLRHCFADDSIDLVYLDPPFKSDQNYNLLFQEKDGSKSASQILAFEDTWEWNVDAERNYTSVAEKGGKLGQIMAQFRTMLGDTDMLAYLSMMAPRLIELQRVLRPTGSIYLHCDPTASHYLKLLMDAVFGPEQFRNEIVWKRKTGRGETNNAAIRFGVTNDILLFYGKTTQAKFCPQYRANNPHYIRSKFTNDDGDGRLYHLDNISSPSYRANLCYAYKGHEPPPKGWAVCKERMEQMDREGRLYIPADPKKRIRRKRYLDELIGENVDTLWDDIPPINSQAQERLGYPTQKPQALLERLINASSKQGDLVLDPFCGCGTAIEASQKLHRRWIGIDITIQAMRVTRNERLPKLGNKVDYDVIYRPCDISAAAAFAAEQPFAFQDWAVDKLDGVPSRPRSGDRGIDGRLYFREDGDGPLKHIIVSVKGGKLKATFVRELQGAVARDRAPMGILIVLNNPTKQMIRDAASSGFYRCSAGTYPKIQIITVNDILADIRLDLPPIQRMDESRKRMLAVDAATQLPLPGIAS